MFNKKTVKDVDLRGKTVLLRADYNVPIEYAADGEARILSDFRIRASLPTLRFLIEAGVQKIVLISHLGRPKSITSKNEISSLERLASGDFKFSLKPVFENLQEKLLTENLGKITTKFLENPIFEDSDSLGFGLNFGAKNGGVEIVMLENLRFSKSEKQNLREFAEKLVKISDAEIFVQDGFGVIHRAHTSTSAIAQILPSVAGLLLEKEVSTISRSLDNPEKPVVAIMGGAKISDKISLIEKFVEKSDAVIIGGAMANTFLDFHKFEVGKSKVEKSQDFAILQIEATAREKFGKEFREKFILPNNVAAAKSFEKTSPRKECLLDEIEKDDMILDCGRDFAEFAAEKIQNARTIIWNGTLGMAEFDNFAESSKIVAEAISRATKNGATSVIGGGDTASFAINWSKENPDLAEFSLISTGGGAALELMSGKSLPGLEILPERLA